MVFRTLCTCTLCFIDQIQVHQKRSCNAEFRRITCAHITIVDFRVVYREKNDRIPSLYTESAWSVRFSSFYDCFSPYTVTKMYDRNTVTGNTTKGSRIRS